MFDVAIVGYGPVGAVLASLLGRAGLRVAVLEREPGVFHNPRAASLDAEAMRVLQAVGIADAIEPSLSRASGMRFVNAEGRLLLHWQRHGPSPEGWHPAYRFHQPALETRLRHGVARLPTVAVSLGVVVGSVTVAADHVTLDCRASDGGAPRTVAARFVVGCDGARSIVRDAIGGGLRELGPRERWMVLDLMLDDATPEDATPLGDSWQHCDPARPATYIPMAGRRRRWEFMLMPGDDPAVMVEPARIWALLRPWRIGPEQARIERVAVYAFGAAVAERWRSGRLLIAGDAAHQMPPFLGQGLCAGLRDAANLAWKLISVLRGDAAAALLDTYGSERAPQVTGVVALAVRLGAIIQATDPASAAARDRAMLDTPEIMRLVMPPLGPGLHGNAPPPAGARAAQPKLADGRRLDDTVGYRFCILATPALLASVEAAMLDTWRTSGIAVIAAEGEAADWLGTLGHAAVVIRPDRAILAVGGTAAELTRAAVAIPGVASNAVRIAEQVEAEALA